MIDLKAQAYSKIQDYINKCDYTWTVNSLLEEYEKYLKGSYISFTAKDCIKNNTRSFLILSTVKL